MIGGMMVYQTGPSLFAKRTLLVSVFPWLKLVKIIEKWTKLVKYQDFGAYVAWFLCAHPAMSIYSPYVEWSLYSDTPYHKPNNNNHDSIRIDPLVYFPLFRWSTTIDEFIELMVAPEKTSGTTQTAPALCPLCAVRFLHICESADDLVMQSQMQRELGRRTGASKTPIGVAIHAQRRGLGGSDPILHLGVWVWWMVIWFTGDLMVI